MKRRGFLGFLGGAAVAGPGMVKQAAAQTVAELALPSVGFGVEPVGYATQADDRSWFNDKWRAFQSIVNSAEALARRKREIHVTHLDPDLANCRSFSLDAKIRMQRERNFKAWLEREQGWFARNWDGYDETSRWYY